jgi:hypothetical protein
MTSRRRRTTYEPIGPVRRPRLVAQRPGRVRRSLVNRHLRRAAKAKGRKLDRATAVHEAGHAVARILVADDFSRPPEEMVRFIDMGQPPPVGDTFLNKTPMLNPQATTYGATFSVELELVLRREAAVIGRNEITEQEVKDVFTAARTYGIDVDRWLRARLLIMTLASVAEAKHRGRPIHAVWNSPESECDRRDAFKDGYRAGFSDGQIEQFVSEALARSEELIRQDHVQRAIEALADALPDRGKMFGHQVAAIVNHALQASPAPAFTGGCL